MCDPLNDGISKVELIEHNNDDLTVVNAARCSFGKNKTELDATDIKLINYLAKHNHWTPFGHAQVGRERVVMREDLADWLLQTQKVAMRRVALPYVFFNHASLQNETSDDRVIILEVGSIYSFIQADKYPLSSKVKYSIEAWQNIKGVADSIRVCDIYQLVNLHPNLSNSQKRELLPATIRFKMPIFVDRQWKTHKQDVLFSAEQVTRSEVSRRYVDDTPEFYTPKELRLRAESVKQGSSDEVIAELGVPLYMDKISNTVNGFLMSESGHTKAMYELLLDNKVAPELARMLLPLNTYTEFWQTASLAAWKRIVGLRTGDHAQKEIKEYADAVDKILTEKFEDVWTNG